MLSFFITKLVSYPDDNSRYNYLREYLQLLLLKILDEKGHFQSLAFVGGTALRIVYQLKRFSEDLDFSLVNKRRYSLKKIVSDLQHELTKYNLLVQLIAKDHNNVAVIQIKFSELLFALGLTKLKDEKIFIKMEIDQVPPTGFATELSVVNQDFFVTINHYDLPSLFASKLHAILHRKYTKGRDYYDLLWYFSNKIKPNLTLLNNSILQTQGVNPRLDGQKLIALLTDKIKKTDFKKVLSDVEPFLQDHAEARLFNEKVFLAALRNDASPDIEVV